ncbi:hypothetical protein BU25DRAFT_8190 [Macroventuria anomochaeta]|uniref:Uncharacterized protein n=1 Tax=Macroventuria anomochaeta TaxID=301207 RepID=A0ACB6SJ73_9PLEO|nr:uncharacterized protein BU25DRAFT_8190 [Macroventuria anomochaeta]KAF2633533.1 hypothetical protein BU25DRAFT_8190 [Macroventuria anomochaeta]
MLAKVSAIVLIAATCIATPTPNKAVPYSWAVHNFNGTCSAATCWAWGFSISSPIGPSDQPAFKAIDCSLDSRINEHQACRDVDINVPGSVAVQIDGASQFGGLLSVQYTFQQGPIRYTYYGNYSVVRCGDGVQPDYLQPAEFSIVPHAVSAVGL